MGTGGGLGSFFGTWQGSRNLNKKELAKRNAGILSAATLSDSQKKELINKNIEEFNAKAFTPNFSHISMGAAAAGSAITLLSKAFKDAGP
jgi:hypothetical protein